MKICSPIEMQLDANKYAVNQPIRCIINATVLGKVSGRLALREKYKLAHYAPGALSLERESMFPISGGVEIRMG